MKIDKYDRKVTDGRDEVIHSLDQQSFQALLFNSFLNQQHRKRGALRSMQRLAGILALVEEVAACSDSSRVLNEAASKAVEITGATGAAIALMHEDAMMCVASSGATAPELGVPLALHSGLSGESVRTGKTLVCLDTESDARVNRVAARSLCARSMVVIPMRQNTTVIGVLEALAPEPGGFDAEDVVTLEVLANVAVLGIEHCKEMANRQALERERSDIQAVLEQITPAITAAIAEQAAAAAATPPAAAPPVPQRHGSSSAILAAKPLPLSRDELQSLAESLSSFKNTKPRDGNGQPPR